MNTRNQETVRWAILGAGKIAGAFATGIFHAPHAELQAVASRTQKKAEQFATEFGAHEALGSYEDLLQSPNVDAVYVATPHPMHAEWAMRLADAGKHILVEKPIGLNHPEAMAIFDAASQAGVFAMEAFMYRCHPQTKRITDLIRDGAIGEVRQIESSFGFNMPFDADHRIFNNALGGGAIMDVGCYPMSAARLIAGAALDQEFAEPLRIDAIGHLGRSGVDEWASALLQFPNDIQARLATSVSLGLPWNLIIYGSLGNISVPSPWHIGGVGGGKSSIVLTHSNGETQEIDTSDARGLYAIEAESASQAILDDGSECVDMRWDDTLGNMKALETWRRQIGLVYQSEKSSALRSTLRSAPAARSPSAKMPMGTVAHVDKPVSRLVMGCDNQTWMPQASVMFDTFIEAGGNTFDTAHLYGDGIMERLLGKWIDCHQLREDVVIIGKGAHTPNCRPDAVEPQLLDTLERLQTDYVDIYFFHRDDENIPVDEFVDAINQQISVGRVRTYGGSNWTLPRIVDANAYAKKNALQEFSAVSNQFSLAQMVNPVWPGCYSASTEDYVHFLKETQTSLFGWSSLARGFFTSLSAPNKLDNKELVNAFYSDINFERKKKAIALAEKLSGDPIQIALSYVLAQPFPTFPLIGPRTLEELRSSLKALDVRLVDEDVRYLESRD